MFLQTIAPTIKTAYSYTVSEEEAQANQKAEADRRAARKAAKAAAQQAEADRRARQLAAVKKVSVETPVVHGSISIELPAPELPQVRIVSLPNDEEQVAVKTAYRRREAEIARANLIAHKRESNPSLPQFILWVVGAGFVHDRDAGQNAIYTCEGVEMVVFGSAFGTVKEVRQHKVKPVPTIIHATDPGMSPAERRARNKKIAEEQRTAKKARQEAIKAARKPVVEMGKNKKNKKQPKAT